MTIALRPPLTGPRLRTVTDRAQSTDGKRLSELWDQVLEHYTVTNKGTEALAALNTAVASALVADWDGYGAHPVEPLAYERARSFLDLLPTTAPVPDVGVVPDGGISFEWHTAPRWTFSVVVRPTLQITYAGLFGVNNTHGTELFFNDEIPKGILEKLLRHLSKLT
jgi:hypothetical protein